MGINICKKKICIDVDYLNTKNDNYISTNMINITINNNGDHQVTDNKKFFYNSNNKIDLFKNINENSNYIKKIILIQKNFRKFVKFKQKSVISNKKEALLNLHQFTHIKMKSSLKSLESFFYRAASKEQFIYSRDLTRKSDRDPNNKYAPFNLLTKKYVKYKYYGYLKKSPEFPNKNIKSGFGIIKYVDGSIFTGKFTNNKSNGICLYQDNINGDFIGEYVDNIPNGFGIYKNE